MAYNIFERWPFTSFQNLNLDWLLKAMQEALEKSANAEETAENLKQFVNTYFDNLDVQEEINTKIDEMVESGEFLDTFDQLLPSIIAAWLDENITPTSPVVDASLTISGAAADAKVTGDKLGSLKSAFVGESEGKLPFFLVENEYINASSGAFQPYNGWSRTELIPVSGYSSIKVRSSINSGYNAYYKADGTVWSQVFVGTTETDIAVPTEAAYVAFSNTTSGMEDFEASFVSRESAEIEKNKSLAISGIDKTLSVVGDFVPPYDNCDTFPNNSVVTITYNAAALVQNLPTDFNSGTIITMNSRPQDATSTAQIAIFKDGYLMSRHKWVDTWSQWGAGKEPYVSMSMFPNFGVVGDSFASGTILIESGTIWGMYRDYSWPNILSRIVGSAAYLYSSSGLSTRTWLTSAEGLTKALADTPKTLYLLCLGINDGAIYNEDSSYLGTVQDIKQDYTQNPDTFYGNYGKIIDQLEAHAPDAKFIMIAPPAYLKSSTWSIFQTAISNIASHYSFPFIAGDADEYFDSDFFQTNKSTDHPLAITYSGMAKAYKRQIEAVMQKEAQYFNNVH